MLPRGLLHLLDVLWRQLRLVHRDRELGELLGEREWDLVVGVI
jgi:hypothetical protein